MAFKNLPSIALGGAFMPVVYREPALQQSGSLTFTPADDAHIHSGNPASNYGSATTLQVDNEPVKHFLSKFDVTGVNGQTITNAKLRLSTATGYNAGRNANAVGQFAKLSYFMD